MYTKHEFVKVNVLLLVSPCTVDLVVEQIHAPRFATPYASMKIDSLGCFSGMRLYFFGYSRKETTKE